MRLILTPYLCSFNRFDEEVKRVELDYPRDMSMWRGIGYNIDTAFQDRDGEISELIVFD